jgi:hypothetical protein
MTKVARPGYVVMNVVWRFTGNVFATGTCDLGWKAIA